MYPHALAILEYAQDCLETGTPWDRWEREKQQEKGLWVPLYQHPTWLPNSRYRKTDGSFISDPTDKEEPLGKLKHLRAAIRFLSKPGEFWECTSADDDGNWVYVQQPLWAEHMAYRVRGTAFISDPDGITAEEPHIHAEAMVMYAQDAGKTKKPWELWEATYKGVYWEPVTRPTFTEDASYRRKDGSFVSWGKGSGRLIDNSQKLKSATEETEADSEEAKAVHNHNVEKQALYAEHYSTETLLRIQEMAKRYGMQVETLHDSIVVTLKTAEATSGELQEEPPRHLSLTVEARAMVAYEAVRTLGKAYGETDRGPWEDRHNGNRDALMHCVSLVLGNPHITPAETHAAWVEYIKKAYKDPTRYPGMEYQLRPFDKLALKDQLKWELTLNVVRCLS